MKKFVLITLAIFLILFSIISCGKKVSAPKAGSAKALDMLNLLPKEAIGIFIVDVHRILTTEIADKAIKENKNYQKYQEFVKESGIDPQKQIFFIAAAIMGEAGGMKQQAVGVVNLKYDKNLLLDKMKKTGKGIKEEVYNGVTIYSSQEEEETKKLPTGAFLDESNIVVGNENGVKTVIDIYQKKKENVLKNEKLEALIKTANKDALIWSVFTIPKEATQQAASQNPMLKNLESISSLSLYFDYRNKSILVEIKAMSPDENKNKQIVDLLNGVKAMGSMASTKDPNVGELLNRIEISSTADQVKISANIPEDLINKLKESAAKKLEEKLGQKPKEN
jgi:hypothetical protein